MRIASQAVHLVPVAAAADRAERWGRSDRTLLVILALAGAAFALAAFSTPTLVRGNLLGLVGHRVELLAVGVSLLVGLAITLMVSS
jgi:hypothetical protein